jgi:hypothetical protein
MPLPDIMNLTATFYRKTYANVAGLTSETTVAVVKSVAIHPKVGKSIQSHDEDGGVKELAIYCETDPGVKAGDTVTWGTHTAEILSSAGDIAGLGRLYLVNAIEVDE